MPNVVAIGQTVVEISRFWIFQDGGSHHLGTVKKDKLRHCAKFRQNRLNRGRDMAIFSIFQGGGAAILNF